MALTIVASLLLGWMVTRRLWPDGLFALERWFYASAIGVLCWLASAWVMGLTHTLVRPVAIGRTVGFLVVGIVFAVKKRWTGRIACPPLAVVVLIAIAAWTAFILWRGALLPVLSHDALAYHFPAAMFFVRAHGYVALHDLAWILPPRPPNYELLLADALVSDGVDTFTEWIGTLFYLMFVIGSGALAQRWWRSGPAATACMVLAVAGVPLALLHSGAHKNDLMLAVFVLAAFVAGGRFLTTGERASLALSIASLVAAAGTKTHGAIVAACFLPFLAWRVLRPFSPRLLAFALAIGIAATALLGGADYLVRAAASKQSAATGTTIPVQPYGDWSNLWRGPYVLLAEPFSPSALGIYVPWSDAPLFWRKDELYFSHFGHLFTVAALALPLALWLLRRRPGGIERWSTTVAAFAVFAAILPVHFNPPGIYLTYLPRFVFFLLPVVFAWTLVPLVEALTPFLRNVTIGALLVLFVINAANVLLYDAFAPLDYVLWVRQHPGTRVIHFDRNRAESIADRMAGPRDRVLLDAGYGAWIYPAFGEHFTRDVRFLRPGGPITIPDDIDWIVVDHAWNTIWGNPKMPLPDDLRTIHALASDPRFQVVAWRPQYVQAVFRRIR